MDTYDITTTAGPVTIRLGDVGDAPGYRALRLEALRLHPSAFSGDLETAEAMTAADWEARLAPQEDLALFFAVNGAGALIGSAGVRLGYSSKTRHNSELIGVYVRPFWRGRGVAQALMRACLDWARAHGAIAIKLGVESENLGAIRSYSHQGFEEYAREPQALYVDDRYYDFVLMRRSFDEPASG